MARKRVILASGSRLLREMLQRVINKADNLEVVQEVTDPEELPAVIASFDPDWAIVSLPFGSRAHSRVDAWIAAYPSVRFILLAPDHSSIKMRWQSSAEEDLTNLSLKDFIHILEKDLQHI